MSSEDWTKEIDALAYRFWSIHPKDIPDPVGMPERYPGGARAWFYATEMRKLAEAQGADFLRGWETGRDAAANYVQEMAPSYKEYDSGRDALNDAVDAIRSLTPPEDAP
jgi:hypothetical protein